MIASLCWVPVNAHAPFKDGTIFKPFSVTFTFSCGRGKTIQKCNVWKQIFLKTEEKYLRFQTKTDSCGRGHRACLREVGGGGERPQVGEVTYLSIYSLILI